MVLGRSAANSNETDTVMNERLATVVQPQQNRNNSLGIYVDRAGRKIGI